MAAQWMFDYPEFLAAFLVSIFAGFAVVRREGVHAPEWLASPAKACLMLLPPRYVSWLVTRQMWAGLRHNAVFGDIACLKLYIPAASFALAAFLPLAVVPAIAASIFFFPDLVIFIMAAKRQGQIRQSLPQALDLMVLCVDAGLGLDATLARIAGEQSGVAQALNEELLNLNRDILLGMDRERAYQEMYVRTGVDELKTLGSALNQSNKMGLSIAKILRAQSDYMRTKQSQKADERAHKLPIYMAFPLWFCVMPALMVIVLAPSLIMFFEQMQFQPGLLR